LEEKGELNKHVVKMDTHLQVLNVRREGTRLERVVLACGVEVGEMM
jgi:hypothetical protein